jgi:hypothetical protein
LLQQRPSWDQELLYNNQVVTSVWRSATENLKMKQVALLLLSLPCLTSALDLEFDSIQCDTKLPAYAEENGITMTCNGSTRCTMGDSAVISGESKFRIANSIVFGLYFFVNANFMIQRI